MTTTADADYPVNYDVEEQLTDRSRLSVAFRIILAIPHLLLVGGPGIAFGLSAGEIIGDDSRWISFGGSGVLGAVAGVMALISWFAIVITGKQPKGLWDFTSFYLRWRSKSMAYAGLLRDEYPPFGEGEYPARLQPGEYLEVRNRVSVFFRIFLLIPHLIVLFFVGIAWAITALIGWFAVLFTGSYPEGLYRFAIGYMRWSLRVEAYALLMNDKFPPFSLE
jgi:hypothetical protein